MLARLGHRGPDEAGYLVDDGAALGSVRLRIIDIATGAQPMCDPTRRHWIVYNGEVYNYLELRRELEALGETFATRSDTEVVLRAWLVWGVAGLTRLNGPFAFAVYDTKTRRCLLARDRFGKRPLYFTRHDGGLAFASESKAFAALPGFRFELDPAAVAGAFAQWTALPHQSAFLGVEQLPLGGWLEVGEGLWRSGIFAAWPPEALAVPNCPDTPAEAARTLRETLRQSVELRLRSDVEVGLYLSGGLDSTITGVLASEVSGRVPRTFSVAFEDPELDESRYQALACRHLGSQHTTLNITGRDIAEAFPKAVLHAEVPVFRTALVPMLLLSDAVRGAGIKTILSGEGADEIFLGYGLFRETLLRRRWEELDTDTRKDWIARSNPYLGHYSQEHHGPLLGMYRQYLEERIPGLYSHELRLQNGRFALRLLRGAPDPLSALSAYAFGQPGFAALGAVEKAQWLELHTLLPGYLLSSQGERMGMAHGVENRCPFLDPAVAAAARVANPLFPEGGLDKAALKAAFAADLPQEILLRHKHPYRAPDSASFVAHRPDYLEALLSEAELAKVPLIEPGFAAALTRKILTQAPETISVRENQAFILMLSLALLHRQFCQGPVPCASGAGAAILARLTVAQDLRTEAA
ncbi:asparagine synthase (glutamine-hydrolyzing) [Humidesulfovibrio idahonensis]